MELTYTPKALSIEYNEPQLVKNALAGDYRSFDILIEHYSQRIFRLALRMLGRREDAEDVQQECFISAYKNLRKFRGDSSFGTWLYSIAVKLCLSRKRKVDWSTWQTLDDTILLATTAESGPEEQLFAVESADKVHRVLGKLPPPDRLLIVLRFIEELKHDEIAGVLGCSIESSRARLLRAKRLFRKQYEMME